MIRFHTVQCIKEHIKHLVEQLEWVAKYPNCCPECGGSGVVTWEEDLSGGDPPGAGWLTFHDDCVCIENNQCPRCLEYFGLDQMPGGCLNEDAQCNRCGWKRGTIAATATHPGEYECNCGEMINKYKVVEAEDCD